MSNGARFSSCAYNVPDDPYDTLTSTACAALKRAITSPIAAFRSDAAATRTVDRLPAAAAGPAPPRRAGRERTGLIVAISGRNQLRGYVDEVRVEGLLAQVRLRIGDQALTAVITRDAVEELKLRRGDEALAIVKSTEVMVAREAEPPRRPPNRRAAR